jgi:phospholipid N-methyltransferase
MKLEWPWKSTKITVEKDLQTLENQLDAVMQPVEVNPDFAKKLRKQLVGRQKRKIFNWESPKLRTGLLVAGGVVSFFAMVITGIRVISAFIGARSLGMQHKKAARA